MTKFNDNTRMTSHICTEEAAKCNPVGQTKIDNINRVITIPGAFYFNNL